MLTLSSITTFIVAAPTMAALALTPSAYATSYTSSMSGNWNSASTWGGAGVPGSGDSATVAANTVVTVTDSQSITVLTIRGGNPGGQCDIDGTSGTAAILTITGSSPAMAINASNGVRIVDQYSTLAFAVSVTITGSGSLQGLHSDAVIDLVPGSGSTVALQNNLLVHGAMTIKKSGVGTGNFVNNLEVTADYSSGTVLKLDATLSSIADTAQCAPPGNCCSEGCTDPRWKANVANATLQFDKAANLVGGFRVGPGRLGINANVSTTGMLAFAANGIVDVLNDSTCFSFCSECGAFPCSGGSPFCVDTRCE